MSYRLKGEQLIFEGEKTKIIPTSLPISPEDGQIALDSSDKKLKVWLAADSRWIVLGDAEDIVFDNSSNSFDATNVQDAIEESLSSAIEKPRFTIVTTFNGAVGNNNWLGYNELMPGNSVPIRIPMNCKLKEITFSYTDTLIGAASIDGKFKLFKNGFTDPTNVVHTEQFTNQNNGKVVTGLNLSLTSTDFIVGKWIDEGDNPADMAIVYFFQVE